MDQVRRKSKSSEPHLMQANIVLSAITEVISERQRASGGAPKRQFTGTDYMAALLFALGQQGSHSNDSLGAVLYLLSIAVKSVPEAVRHKK